MEMMRGDGEVLEMDKMRRRKREQKMWLGSREDENYTTIYKSNQKPCLPLYTSSPRPRRVLLMLWWICAMFTCNVGPCGLGGRAAALGCDFTEM
jgi:hypothetical protein